MDISTTTIPDSTQINFDDLALTPVEYTVESVSAGTPEQPVNIALKETPGRAFRPAKSMRRVLVAAWGPDSSSYVGRKIALFGDPTVKFGRDTPGGVRIAGLSHIDGPLSVPLTVSRGKRSMFTVQPITEPAPNPAPKPTTEPTPEQVADCTDSNELHTMWLASGPELRAQIEARKAELDTTAPSVGDDA